MFSFLQKILAGKVQEQETGRGNARIEQEKERIFARVRELEEQIKRERIEREQEKERIFARVRELEEEIRQREIIAIEQQRKNEGRFRQERIIGVEYLNEQLNFDKKKNIPNQVKEIFENYDIPVFSRNRYSSSLLNEFRNNKESKSIITQHLEDFMIKGKIPIGCSDCYLWPDVLDYVFMISEVEKLVVDKVEKQVEEDYEDFSEWNDDPDTVKLTLIFNIFGLSPEIIKKFGPEVNGWFLIRKFLIFVQLMVLMIGILF